MPSRFQQILRSIGKACQDSTLTEAEVEKIFQDKGIFSDLGYDGFGIDIFAQRGKSKRRFDLALLGFGGRVRSVIEFKRANVEDVAIFRDELYDKYVKPHLALSGVLTNGVDLVVYARTGEHLVEQMNFKLLETTEQQATEIQGWLQKKKVQLESLDSVLELLRYHRQNPLLISDTEAEPARIFFQVFRLSPGSAFGRLVSKLKEMLPEAVRKSRFTRGSYEFWLKTYARELSFKDIPKTWKDFLLGTTANEINQLSFALETAYTIVSRLMLAKAADDRGFPGVRFVPRIQESLNELSVRNNLKPEHYLEIVGRSFKRASEALFSTIFLQDIFDWWFESPKENSRPLFLALGEAMLAVTQFNFYELSGDLLGELYQRYFDRDTRKALGEFYTPPEVIEFILNECGYRGQRDRLLDPACGSGSFLTAALRRYLRAQKGASAKKTLNDLTEGLRIVGFDINPFAVLLAQVNYAALVLPLYAEAIHEDPDFRILRLPVFRTDSLRIEEREEDGAPRSKDAAVNLSFRFEESTLNLSIYLPVKGEKKPFHRMFIRVPRYGDARAKNLVNNLEEYLAALARVFESVRDKRSSLESLLRGRFGNKVDELGAYLQPTVQGLEEAVAELRDKYEDGRFLKAIEDLVLAVSLKHDLQYDFVVGNPPYVRIQKIPGHVKEYWNGKYEWAQHNYDLYIPFLERAVRSAGQDGWLGKKGRLGFILSDRFLNVEYGTKLREEMPESLRLDLLLDFRDTRVFAEAMNYPAILIAEKDDKGRSGALEGARIFTSDVNADSVFGEFQVLRKRVSTEGIVRGSGVEVFTFPRDRLAGPGWWIMPEDERNVFDKLQRLPSRKLIELTATSSAGFAGYQTSADTLLVFDEVEDLGLNLRVLPRHTPNECGCSKKPLEIEKAALRPFLFGRDVIRWSINWTKAWVMFPYDRFARKRTLEGEVIEEWNLIPSKANIDKFEFLNREKICPIEDRFPKAWKYLCKHEKELRRRENDRYAKEASEQHLWYGATYPRGLDHYFAPKLVVQLLSRRNSFVLDERGDFVFQAGGKGGGVYGIAPSKDVGSVRALLAFLNSKVVDFLLKETSSVYGGRYYSYADQFLKDLPIPDQIVNSRSSEAKDLSGMAERLADATEKLVALSRKLKAFPVSFAKDITAYEVDSIGDLAISRPASAQLSVEMNLISVEKTLYGFSVNYGPQRAFEFPHREQAECLARAFRTMDRATLHLEDVLSWRLPLKREGCVRLLDLAQKVAEEIDASGRSIESEEERLNELTYKLCRVTKAERRTIDGFLDRYSSRPIGSPDPEEPTAEE